jgi:hypothetical protein
MPQHLISRQLADLTASRVKSLGNVGITGISPNSVARFPLKPPLSNDYNCLLVSKQHKDRINYGRMPVMYIGRWLSQFSPHVHEDFQQISPLEG